jgi:hypothetical protein
MIKRFLEGIKVLISKIALETTDPDRWSAWV